MFSKLDVMIDDLLLEQTVNQQVFEAYSKPISILSMST